MLARAQEVSRVMGETPGKQRSLLNTLILLLLAHSQGIQAGPAVIKL